VILAGGQSRRLGTDKALLELDGESLLARAVHKLAALSDDVIVVTNNPDNYEHLGLVARFVPDEQPGEGALMGVYSGLKVAAHDSALAVACDMPFFSVPLLRYMLPKIARYDVVIPRFDSMLEPLHAMYGKQCLPFMAALLAQGRRQIVSFFGDVDMCYIEEPTIARFDPLRLAFLNVNTTADWQLAQEMLARSELE
jgi:molybdopterin-guanine dinucleotide biosynthesis protein A